MIWLAMFVTTCMAGMVAMATLNGHQEVITIRTTTVVTAATTPITNTTSIGSSATTTNSVTSTESTTTTTRAAPTALLFISTYQERNEYQEHILFCNSFKIKKKIWVNKFQTPSKQHPSTNRSNGRIVDHVRVWWTRSVPVLWSDIPEQTIHFWRQNEQTPNSWNWRLRAYQHWLDSIRSLLGCMWRDRRSGHSLFQQLQ